MSLSNPFSTKTARVSKILASEINNAGTAISQAVDGTGGGSYTPTAAISIGGAQGLQIESDSKIAFQSGGAITGTLALSATTTASDLTMSGTNKVKLASRSIGPRVQKAAPTTNDPTTWSLQAAGLYMQQIANAKDYVIFALDVPHGATLTEVRAHLKGANGHGLSMPVGADRPDLAVHEIPTDGNSNLVGGVAVTDTSADATAYELKHRIDLTDLSHVIDREQYRYVAVIGSETGGNYIAGLRVYAVDCTYTVDEMDDG